MNKVLLRSKFRGCLLGSLVGDCCGAPFEGDTFTTGAKIVLQKYFDTLEGKYFNAPVKKYTADSCMTKSVAQCLTAQSTINPSVLAKTFTKEFLNDPRRGYEENLISIFNKLRASQFTEPLKPAREPAIFTSSSDNGAALRIAPVALVHLDNYDKMLQVARQTIEITHTHREGVMGALVQCVAVHQSLNTNPEKELDVVSYTDELMEKVNKLETDKEGLGATSESESFIVQLTHIKSLLTSQFPPTDEEILNKLGHSPRALYSVPTALYCYLRGHTEGPNPFRGTLQLAVSLGGDTNAIAGMAGALAGAHYGQEKISQSLLKHCEGTGVFEKLADELFDVSGKS